MKVLRTRTELSEHARNVLDNMAAFYKLPKPVLLRVILESMLDAASEDGDMQSQIAAGARDCLKTGHVPECWLGLEFDAVEHWQENDSGYNAHDLAPAKRIKGIPKIPRAVSWDRVSAWHLSGSPQARSLAELG